MKKICGILTILILGICPAAYGAQQLVSGDLSLEGCIVFALENHPALREAAGATSEQEGRLESLRVNDRATAQGGASYGYSDSPGARSENSYSVSGSASKTIYDTGKNRLNKSAQRLAIRQASEGEADTRLLVVTDVKRAYYSLLLASKNLDVVRDQLSNLELHLEQAQGYYEVGSRPRIDVTKAEVDVANAKVDLLKAEASVRLAWQELLVSMGDMNYRTQWGGLDVSSLTTPLDEPQISVNAEAMTERALMQRPDYIRSKLGVESSLIRIQSAARSDAPTVSVSTGGSYSGREFPLRDNFNAGVRVDFPIFDGGEKRAEVAIARAQLTQAEASLEALGQQIVYEVRQAVVDLENAQARIRSSEETLQYARENLELAQGRYGTGVGSPLEVSDAVSDLSEALFNRYQALHDAQAAVVALEKATGREMDAKE